MRSRIATVMFAASMIGAAPTAVLAQTQFTFKDPGTTVAWNFYVGNYHAYEGTGTSKTVTINCVDFYHGVSVPQVWNADLTDLSTATVGVTTRFDNITLYKEAAYLTTMYATYTSAADIGTIQSAIWHLFDGVNATIGFSASANNLDGVALNNLAPLSGQTHSYSWWITAATTAAAHNYYGMNFSGYYVVTDVKACDAAQDASASAHAAAIADPSPNGCHYDGSSVQEFIMYDPTGGGNQTSTPEPATLVLFGSGLLGIAGVRIRRKKLQS